MGLTKKELEFLKELLLKEKSEAEKEIKKLETPVVFRSEPDRLEEEEESDEIEEMGNRLSVETVLKHKLLDIEKALSKMEKGTYGFCEKCGKPISFKILKTEPASMFCQKCKKEKSGRKNSR